MAPSFNKRWKTKISLQPSVIELAKIALLPSALPEIYAYVRRLSPDTPFLSEAVTSPALLLLPSSWRLQIVLQVAAEAMLQTGKGTKWRGRLPPTWTLNVVGNVWLLWAFLFNSKAFPKTYENIILSVRLPSFTYLDEIVP